MIRTKNIKKLKELRNKPLANGDEFMKFVERASMNELSQIGQMGGFEMPTSDMLGDTSGQLEIAETIFPGATIGDTLSAIDAAVQLGSLLSGASLLTRWFPLSNKRLVPTSARSVAHRDFEQRL